MNRSLTNHTPARNVRVDAFVAQMHRADRADLAQAIEQQDMAEIERVGIAGRIKSAREEAGLSQPEMAEALGVIPRTYQNYESLTKPRTPWGLMNQIATVTGKSTEWLIHGAPDMLGAMKNSNDSQLDRIETALVVLTESVAAMADRLTRLESPAETSSATGEKPPRNEERPPAAHLSS